VYFRTNVGPSYIILPLIQPFNSADPTDVISVVDTKLPHEVLVLGQKYAEGTIMGGNARCRAMLHTFKQLVEQYQPGPNVRDIRNAFYHSLLKPAFQHWTEKCRPHCVSMGNAFSFLKAAAAALDRDMSLDEMKEELADTMDRYIKERIEYAGVAITSYASSKIMDGDVILTFGRSEVVQEILLDCANKKTIHVICSDSRPLLEGKQMLEPLTKAGIPCSYVLLNALSHVMRNATKVLLGASAIMSNGSIMSRVGTACVALMAHSHHVPVLVCCESYKISHRIQLESITSNELGNPDGASGKELKDWITTPNLRLLNLLYDLTPSQYVSGIITEMGIVPPTSVAVLLRELNKQDQAVVVD